MIWLVPVVVVALVSMFVVAAWSPKWLAARDRLSLLLNGMTAAAMALVGRALIDWGVIPLVVWYLLIALLAAGAAGAALRWRRLPWLADPAKRVPRIWGAAVSAVFLVALAAVVSL